MLLTPCPVKFAVQFQLYSEAQIWLIYTYLKMGNIDLAKNKLDQLEVLHRNGYDKPKNGEWDYRL